MASSRKTSYIIVGSGVFGASTAYDLSKSHPEASIVLVDRSASFPCPLAASHDFNKIIRADYGNLFYCKLALEARESWKLDPLYKEFYHQSGFVSLDDTGLGRKIIKNYEELQINSGTEIIGTEELKSRYEGLFEDANYQDVDEIFVSPQSGWAEATPAVRAVINASIANGVQCIQGDVESLLFDSLGGCIGVRTRDDRVLHAEKVILSTGAGTQRLLAKSAPKRQGLQSGDRITAAAVVTGVVKLNEQQLRTFAKSPIFIHSMSGVLGEVLPPTPDGILKFCVDVSFKNTTLDQTSQQMISAPPDYPDQAQQTVPETLKEECRRVKQAIYGKKLSDFEFDSFRICWDGITPNQDFIISSHPRCENLYIATGGSFHGWKFLPIIGKYVTALLNDQLDEELQKRWAWDRDQKGSAHEKVIPQRELKDLS